MSEPELIADDTRFTPARLMILLFVVALAAVLVWAVWSLPANSAGLTMQSLVQLPKSGVTNPVTAAVLNYRGYDTLLEIAVMLVAALGVWSVGKAEPRSNYESAGPVLVAFVRLALPLMILVAGYLLWIGAFAPGGAFQAGAVLAGAVVALLLSGGGRAAFAHEGWLRIGLVLGLAVFIAVAVGAMTVGGKLLEYPPKHAGNLILLIESAALVSIALTLTALFVGGRPRHEADTQARKRKDPDES